MEYEYNKVKFHFYYDFDAKTHLQTEIWILANFHYTDGRQPKESKDSFTSEQIEKYFVPIISIKKGYDPITSSLLYLNDDYCKGFFKRFIDEGTDWFEFSGIKVFPDGTWRIET